MQLHDASTAHLIILPEAISDGGLAPHPDTSLFLTYPAEVESSPI